MYKRQAAVYARTSDDSMAWTRNAVAPVPQGLSLSLIHISMMGGQGAADDDSPENVDSSDDRAGGKAKGTDKIPVVTAVKDMFASVKRSLIHI